MTPLVIIFVAVFVVGPLAFLLFLRLAPSKRRSIGLVCLVVGSTGMSASLRYLSGGWGQDAFYTLAGSGCIWVAWIAVIVFLVQRFCQLDNRPLMRRWTAIIGALATTVPWFGLVSARMMIF
jgi:hypothetical protein